MNDAETNETLQLLAKMCEEGMLERPSVIDEPERQGVKYRLTDEYNKRLTILLDHPEIWPQDPEGRAVVEKLASQRKRKQ